jgi:hypothetical protein
MPIFCSIATIRIGVLRAHMRREPAHFLAAASGLRATMRYLERHSTVNMTQDIACL